MRIACLHLPSLPLQAFLRGAPQWIGAPVAIVGVSGKVVACSRAAWAAGVRSGASALAAHELARDLIAVPASADRAAEKAVVRALADALLAISPCVDVGAEPPAVHQAIYLEVPPKTRGATFGARVLQIVEAHGLRGRIGIADDRFTAWAAASHGHHEHAEHARVVTVPRGGSAAFLAPLPLSLLAIPPEVQHVLGALGVRTLGEFAALPPPSTSHGGWDADYQALARGDGGVGLTGHVAEGAVIERVLVGGDVGLAAAVAMASRRIATRLAGRGRAALTLIVRTGGDDALPLPLPAPTADEADLADAATLLLRGVEHAAFVELEVARDVAGAAAVTTRAEPIEIGSAPSRAPEIPRAAGPEARRDDRSAPVPAPPFQLTPPDAMRPRDAHRRTRRGKQRTRAEVAAQSRLFGLR